MKLNTLLLAILFFVISNATIGQSISIFEIDTTNFPTMKAKFYAFDKDGNQVRPSASELSITEDGTPRTITNVSCPLKQEPKALSSVLVIDVSGSMGGGNINLAKAAANAWVNELPLGKSECAISSFDHSNYINQDFTKDKNKLISGINNLNANGGTDYDAAFITPMTGGLIISKNGKNKKVIVMLTDGQAGPPQIQTIVGEANIQNCVIYTVTLGMACPQSLKDIASQTGGQWFEYVSTEQEAVDVYRKILQLSQGTEPCEINWESTVTCGDFNQNINVQINWQALKSTANYTKPTKAIAKLEFSPNNIKFNDPKVGEKNEQKVTVTAINSDFKVNNVTSNNGAFEITPKNFTLNKGQVIELTVSYFPADSGYNYCKFEIENNICQTRYYVSGGWRGKKPTIRTLKLIHPNGGEVFVAGSDTIITWEGVSPDEPVKLEYRTDDDKPWITVSDSAKGLSIPFRVPNIVSKKYLARITANLCSEKCCDNDEVEICGQIWTVRNLDVITYRNGDTIPEVTDPNEWINLKTGAFCYYNNDSKTEKLYGKLYNWYAINDPRGLAPEGWHIPSDDEITDLENCLGGPSIAGGKLKSIGSIEDGDGLWFSPNLGATNETGFCSNPTCFRRDDGTFDPIVGDDSHFWTSSELNLENAWFRYILNNDIIVIRLAFSKVYGFPVRLVKD